MVKDLIIVNKMPIGQLSHLKNNGKHTWAELHFSKHASWLNKKQQQAIIPF